MRTTSATGTTNLFPLPKISHHFALALARLGTAGALAMLTLRFHSPTLVSSSRTSATFRRYSIICGALHGMQRSYQCTKIIRICSGNRLRAAHMACDKHMARDMAHGIESAFSCSMQPALNMQASWHSKALTRHAYRPSAPESALPPAPGLPAGLRTCFQYWAPAICSLGTPLHDDWGTMQARGAAQAGFLEKCTPPQLRGPQLSGRAQHAGLLGPYPGAPHAQSARAAHPSGSPAPAACVSPCGVNCHVESGQTSCQLPLCLVR